MGESPDRRSLGELQIFFHDLDMHPTITELNMGLHANNDGLRLS